MDFEDLLEPEVAAAAAVTAVIASPQVRNALRRGAVYGLAGLLVAGDALSSFSKGVSRGMRQGALPAAPSAASGNGASGNGASASSDSMEGTSEG